MRLARLTARLGAWRVALLPFVDWRARVTRESLRKDAFAALTNASVMVPQGVAFAAIAGLPPEYGFLAGILPTLVAALFGSSWHLVTGPAAPISALVFSALSGAYVPGSPAYIEAAVTLALLVGVFQLAFAIARLGQLANFASTTVLVGFTTGSGVLIVLGQLSSALGIELPRPQDFLAFVARLVERAPHADSATVAIAATTLSVAIGLRAWRPRLPNYLLALAAGTLAGLAAARLGVRVATIGSLQMFLPGFAIPVPGIDSLRRLAGPALAIALAGLLTAISIARSVATRTGQTIDPNREFLGQGLANLVGSFWSGYPVSGCFNRTAVNVDAGAQTPLAAVFASLVLPFALLAIAPLFAHVPLAAVAAVIILSASGLLNLAEYRRLWQSSRSDLAIATATLVATLLVGLEFAIYAGVLLSLMVFLRWTSRPYVGVGAPDPTTPYRMFRNVQAHGLAECPQLVFARVDGPLYFGAVSHIREQLLEIERRRPEQKYMLIILRGAGDMDAAVGELFERVAARRRARGGRLHVATRLPAEVERLTQLGVTAALGPAALHDNKGAAIAAIVPTLDADVCARCTVRLFHECPSSPARAGRVDAAPADGQPGVGRL